MRCYSVCFLSKNMNDLFFFKFYICETHLLCRITASQYKTIKRHLATSYSVRFTQKIMKSSFMILHFWIYNAVTFQSIINIKWCTLQRGFQTQNRDLQIMARDFCCSLGPFVWFIRALHAYLCWKFGKSL